MTAAFLSKQKILSGVAAASFALLVMFMVFQSQAFLHNPEQTNNNTTEDSNYTGWLNIWKRKGTEEVSEAHALNGFDVLSPSEWHTLVDITSKPLNIQAEFSLLEFGCGAAAYLSKLTEIYPDLHVSGIDYSSELLEKARSFLPKANFYISDIRKTDFLLANSYDVVLSFSVFQYLPSRQAVRQVMEQMLRVVKPGGMILIGDVRDPLRYDLVKSARNDAIKDRQKHSSKDPQHLLLEPAFFEQLSVELNFEV